MEGKDWLGSKLRQVYDDVVREPLPDDMQALLDALDEAESNTNETQNGEAVKKN